MKNFILLAVGASLLTFIIGMASFHIGYESGMRSNAPYAMMELCVSGKHMIVGDYIFDISCIEVHDVR